MPREYPWTLGGLSDDFCRLMDALGVERFHLVGAKIGGTIARAFAARHPARVHLDGSRNANAAPRWRGRERSCARRGIRAVGPASVWPVASRLPSVSGQRRRYRDHHPGALRREAEQWRSWWRGVPCVAPFPWRRQSRPRHGEAFCEVVGSECARQTKASFHWSSAHWCAPTQPIASTLAAVAPIQPPRHLRQSGLRLPGSAHADDRGNQLCGVAAEARVLRPAFDSRLGLGRPRAARRDTAAPASSPRAPPVQGSPRSRASAPQLSPGARSRASQRPSWLRGGPSSAGR